jgi:hypothetical protein
MSVVLLAISPNGLKQALELASANGCAVWCSSDAVSEDEYKMLQGLAISRFSYPLQGESPATLQGAIYTIEEHHPGATVWAEQPQSEA